MPLSSVRERASLWPPAVWRSAVGSIWRIPRSSPRPLRRLGSRSIACLAAARDRGRDAALRATARGLVARGITELPAVRVGGRWFRGERAVAEAAALVQALAAEGRPLAPPASASRIAPVARQSGETSPARI